jgi:hypothetical protein
MTVIATFSGLNIVGLPCDTMDGVSAPSSIEWTPQEKVSVTDGSFNFQEQVFDWQQSMWSGKVSFPAMNRDSQDAWSAFILQCRGQVNAFMIGDPKAALPKGSPVGAPLVNGAAQTGFSLLTRGWSLTQYRLLLPGDFIQIGYRLYKILNPVNSDSSGHATLAIWPNLRDLPADSTPIIASNCKGLFRLAKSSGNGFSTNTGSYGVAALDIREAL